MTIFSARERASTWRQLWVWLAEAERELGLPIPEDAIQEMRENVRVSDEAFDKAREYEAKFRHDVMAHVHAYGEVSNSRGEGGRGKGDDVNGGRYRMRQRLLDISIWGLRVVMVSFDFCSFGWGWMWLGRWNSFGGLAMRRRVKKGTNINSDRQCRSHLPEEGFGPHPSQARQGYPELAGVCPQVQGLAYPRFHSLPACQYSLKGSKLGCN